MVIFMDVLWVHAISRILSREEKFWAKETSETVDTARLINLAHVAILVYTRRASASIGARVHVYIHCYMYMLINFT